MVERPNSTIAALPADMRARYAEHLLELVGEGAPGLVIAFECPQERMAGPPFSVGEDELHRYFPGLELLGERTTEGPQSRASGVTMAERVYHVAAQ